MLVLPRMAPVQEAGQLVASHPACAEEWSHLDQPEVAAAVAVPGFHHSAYPYFDLETLTEISPFGCSFSYFDCYIQKQKQMFRKGRSSVRSTHNGVNVLTSHSAGFVTGSKIYFHWHRPPVAEEEWGCCYCPWPLSMGDWGKDQRVSTYL